MSTRIVYKVLTSTNPRDPRIDFRIRENSLESKRTWRPNYDLTRLGGNPSSYLQVNLISRHRRATKWDYYHECSPYGMISQRAFDILYDKFNESFYAYPATLNGEPYYVLGSKNPLDCFDWENSEYEIDPENPKHIATFKTFRFHLERIDDPRLFRIPESPSDVWATDSIPEIVQKAGLLGFRFLDTSDPEFDHKYWNGLY